MAKSVSTDQPIQRPHPARLFWDSGGLWSLMAWESCTGLGLDISPITAAEIKAGGLKEARLLLVPGGWPALKKQALGEDGARAVREFIENGGIYVGLCGGGGLALSVPDGLSLVDLQRVSPSERLMGASGPLQVDIESPDHAMWRGLGSRAPVLHVWWPAQFAHTENPDIEVLAAYGSPAPGFCSMDIPVDEVDPARWNQLEADYGINLDPARLLGRPAAVQARLGKGRLLLSHLHFDTPGDEAGGRVLRNLWHEWLGLEPQDPAAPSPAADPSGIAAHAQELWHHGEHLGLWQDRLPVMPLWRRASRGLEFWSLVRLCRAVSPGWDRLAPEFRTELEHTLEPVWKQGPRVLDCQACILKGQEPVQDEAQAQNNWFGQPRRCGGDLGRALDLLEKDLFRIIRREP